MYLSRLRLDPRSRSVRRDVADCHQLHRTVMSAFPDVPGGRAELAVLFRIETDQGAPLLYVQSARPPDWSKLPADYLELDWMGGDNPAVRPLAATWEQLQPGRTLRFRLRANPTKRLSTPKGSDRLGARVPLSSDEERLAWLARKGTEGGFTLLRTTGEPEVPAVQVVPTRDARGWRAEGEVRQDLTLAGVQFDGRLSITDADRFRDTLRRGIGPGKAYGFGLLTLAP